MTPRLVGHDLLPSALALNQVIWNSAGLFGPGARRDRDRGLGVSWAYAIDLVTYGAMFVAALD